MKTLDFTKQEYEIIVNDFKFDLRKQEKIIFDMQCQGYKNVEIAKKLNVTTMTIWRKQKELMKKINFFLEEQENLKETYCVYIHKFPNGKVYIGMTRDVIKRWNNGLGYQNNKVMFNDILNYGWNNIEHNVIAENLSYNDAIKIESDKIKEYKSYNKNYGYNTKK